MPLKTPIPQLHKKGQEIRSSSSSQSIRLKHVPTWYKYLAEKSWSHKKEHYMTHCTFSTLSYLLLPLDVSWSLLSTTSQTQEAAIRVARTDLAFSIPSNNAKFGSWKTAFVFWKKNTKNTIRFTFQKETNKWCFTTSPNMDQHDLPFQKGMIFSHLESVGGSRVQCILSVWQGCASLGQDNKQMLEMYGNVSS